MTQLTEKQIWDKLYNQMDKGLITYVEMIQEYSEFIGGIGINEGMAR